MKKTTSLSFISMALAALLLLSACTAPAAPTPMPEAPPPPAPEVTAPQEPAPAPGGGSVLEFQLGEGFMQEPLGEVSFPLDGLLGVPKGDHCPVVFLLHGLHDPSRVTENRYYQGFSYLAQALADQGYLAVSININRAFSLEPFEGSEYARSLAIFQSYLELIKLANDGEAVFEADLTGKADLSKLNFIGHSRGGDSSLAIAKQLQEQGDSSVQSVLLVAAPLITDDQAANYADVPTGIVLSRYDGDVMDLSTATLFNRAWFQGEGRKTPVSMALLYGGNHNRFSTYLPPNDPTPPPQNVTLLDAQTQRSFLTRYAIDFLGVYNQGFDLSLLGETAPARYGIDFMPSLLLPGGLTLLPDSRMTGAQAQGMTAQAVQSGKAPEDNSLAPFYLAGPLEEKLPFYRLSWTEAGQSLTISVPEGDWSQRRSLTLLLANDSTNPVNPADVPLSLEVVLTDKAGAEAAITLDATTAAALRYLPTTVTDLFADLEDMPEYFMGSFPTPMGAQLLPLSLFEGVALTQISSLTLRGQSAAGACIFGGLRVN